MKNIIDTCTGTAENELREQNSMLTGFCESKETRGEALCRFLCIAECLLRQAESD